ncbi:MAG: hypothetical protein HY675_17370 [Chloroflexi bacterium]|nr:hypothetical protein [Chloroflexota bacterium]
MPAETAREARDATAEAVKVAQDAARRYLDESVATNATYFSAWAASAQAALRTAFELQNAGLQTWRGLLDATSQANRSWLDQSAELIRRNQDVTAKMLAACFGLAESTLPRGRAERER